MITSEHIHPTKIVFCDENAQIFVIGSSCVFELVKRRGQKSEKGNSW